MNTASPFAAVIGHPVAHSLSPKLHGFWLKFYDIPGYYHPYDVTAENLENTIKALRNIENFRGCNLTLPHKESMIPLLDAMDAEAQAIGAVNTVMMQDGRLIGSNTDAYGFRANLEAAFAQSSRPALKHKAVIYGAGGAARAVVHAIKQMGYETIVLCNRSEGRAETLAMHMGKPVTVAAWEARVAALEEASLVVNTTSLGLKNERVEWDFRTLPKSAWVTDIVYHPLITSFLSTAIARGNPAVDGLGMLLHQAVPGLKPGLGMNPKSRLRCGS